MKRWGIRALKATLGLLVLGVLAIGLAAGWMRKVTSTDMNPTLKPGDWVWVVPVTPTRGDIVQLPDPNDPQKLVLRRILAEGEQKVRFDDRGLRVNGKRVRQQDEITTDGWVNAKETIWSKPPARPTKWRILRNDRDPLWQSEKVVVPPDHWYVMADNRDGAVDSRWWGPVSSSDIQGVVRFRIGAADEHRPQWQIVKGVPQE